MTSSSRDGERLLSMADQQSDPQRGAGAFRSIAHVTGSPLGQAQEPLPASVPAHSSGTVTS
ncbi:hypothetical protein [Streptomyces sp. NPDC055058]